MAARSDPRLPELALLRRVRDRIDREYAQPLDVEELARKAMSAGRDDRTLFELVRDLRIGVFKARLIQTVERGGEAAHVPLPALSLGGAAEEPTERVETTPIAASPEKLWTTE